MRGTKDVGNFPYSWEAICYIEVASNGKITQVECKKSDIENVYNRVKGGGSLLYAVWPGDYNSELFIVDDLNKLVDAYGINRDNLHIHDIKWQINKYDNPKSRYASVDIEFQCGCKFNYGTIKNLALDLKKQLGWEVATTTGMGTSISNQGCVYTIRVLRKTLKKL